MKNKIKTTIHIPEIPPEVEMESGSLHDLLANLLGRSHFAGQIKDPKTGELALEDFFEVRLNNVPYYSLSRGLNTELREGDQVTISLILLGGG
ncbi:MAG: hypothetical protein HY879_09840 [Deltaproteobacteria bacterium]|nr:hypothetical protein [Deltaproteobacteria bacterium]